MSEYKSVGLFARGGSDLVQESLRAVDTFLRERDVKVYLEDTAAEMLNRRALPGRDRLGNRLEEIEGFLRQAPLF